MEVVRKLGGYIDSRELHRNAVLLHLVESTNALLKAGHSLHLIAPDERGQRQFILSVVQTKGMEIATAPRVNMRNRNNFV